jgi:hypothetical protein
VIKNKQNDNKDEPKLKACPVCGIHLAKEMKVCFGCNFTFQEDDIKDEKESGGLKNGCRTV